MVLAADLHGELSMDRTYATGVHAANPGDSIHDFWQDVFNLLGLDRADMIGLVAGRELVPIPYLLP